MIKKGFTLQELLITMGIIGIVAAITVPALTKIMPDQYKVKYMKAYNTLTNVTAELLSDPTLYFVTYNSSGEPCSGLDCTEKPLDSAPENVRNLLANSNIDWKNAKYGLLLASKLNLKDEPVYASDSVTFTTVDNIKWKVYSNRTILIDVDPNSTKNVDEVFSADVENPHCFEFVADIEGGITAKDALGKAFLQNSSDMHSSVDKINAKKLLPKSTDENSEIKDTSSIETSHESYSENHDVSSHASESHHH